MPDNLTYTRKEREAINAAWSSLESITEAMDWSASNLLRRILSEERSAGGADKYPLAEAKAHVLDAILKAIETEDSPVRLGDIYSLRPSLVMARVLGGAMHQRGADRVRPVDAAFVAKLSAARDAQRAALTRFTDAIMGRTGEEG